MAIKVGDLYVEIYPKINEGARRAAMAQMANDVRSSYGKAFDDVDKRSRESADNHVRDRQRETVSTKRTINEHTSLWSKFWAKQVENSKKNEGIFHKLATNFRTIGTLIRGLSVGALVISGFSTLLTIVQGLAAAAPIVGAAFAALPAIIGGVIAEGLILKAAFKGVGKTVGEAFDPSKAKQFQKDLQKLAPSARSFVLELRRIKGVLPNIQQVFFNQASLRQASSRFRSFAEGISGSLKKLVKANGNLAGQILGAFTSKSGTAKISSFLNNIAKLLRSITPGLKVVTQGFISLADAVAGQGASHGKGINQALIKFGNFLKGIKVKQLFDAAIAAAKGFGQILGNVIDIIGGIGRALGGSQALGAQFFKSLIGITTTIKNFVNSAAGQKFIKQLANTLTILARLVNGVILVGLKLLAGFLTALYPSIAPLAGALYGFLNALVPLGPVLGHIAGILAGALAGALRAATPLLTAIVNFAVNHQTAFTVMALSVIGLAAAIKGLLIAKQVKDAFNNMKDGLNGVKSAIGGAKDIFNKLKGSIFATRLELIALNVWEWIAAAGAYGLAAAEAVAEAVGAPLWAIIGAIIAVIALLVAAIILLVKHWRGVWFAMRVVFEVVRNVIWNGIKLFYNWFVTELPHALRFLQKNFEHVWQQILIVINLTKHSIGVAIAAIHHWFTVTLPSAVHFMWATMVRYWNGFLGIVHIVQHALGISVAAITHWFTVSIPNAAKWLWAQIFKYWNLIRGYTNNLKNWIITGFNAVLHFFTGPVYGGLRKLAAFASSIWKAMYGNVLRYFINPIKKAFETVVDAIRKIWAKIEGFIMTPVNWVKDNVYNKILVPLWNNVVAVLPGVGKISKMAAGGAVSSAVADRGRHAALKRAVGGRVTGPGGPTEDLVPALLSHGEYVIKASTVRQLGTSFFDSLNAGPGNAPFAYGDGSSGVLMSNRMHLSGGGGIPAPFTGNITNWTSGKHKVTGDTKGDKALGGARAGQVLAWLKSIAGRVPYRLGANGPNAFDCSSLVGEVWARLTGHPSNRRYFVTGNEGQFLSHHGFKKGVRVKDSLLVGFNGEHTTGVLDGHRFEAAHTGTRMRFDDGATNALNFPNKYWLPAGHASLLGGALGFIESIAGKGLTYMLKPLQWALARIPGVKNIVGHKMGDLVGSKDGKKNMILSLGTALGNALTKKADNAEAAAEAALEASGSGGSPSNLKLGHGRFNSWAAQASRFVDIPASWLRGLLFIMGHESGGNPSARNPISVGGQHATGLMQMLPSTFRANVPAQIRGWGILNPVANLAAAVNYIHRQYGSPYNTPWYRGKNFYNKGGPVGGPLLRDSGGVLPPGDWLVQNHTGGNEYISRDRGGEYKELHVHVGDEHFVAQIDDRIAKHDNDMIKYIITRHS